MRGCLAGLATALLLGSAVACGGPAVDGEVYDYPNDGVVDNGGGETIDPHTSKPRRVKPPPAVKPRPPKIRTK